jgi:hypothetical protein
MPEHSPPLKVVLVVGTLALIVASVAGALAGKKMGRQRPAPIRNQLKTLPPVSSKIPNIEVLNASLKWPEQSDAEATVEVRNNSYRDITAITLTCGEGGVMTNGLVDPDNPHVVIPAYGTKTLEMNLSEMTPGCSLMVSGVTYGDGGEEGLPETLASMHSIRARDKAEQEAKKGANKQ